MALNLFRRSFPIVRKCSVPINTQPLVSVAPITSRLVVETKPILTAGFASEERPRLGLRKQNLPPYPHIDCVRTLEAATFFPGHYKEVKYGDYDFLESADGFVQVYIQGYQHPRQLDAKSGFSVFFTENSPLNVHGKVERRQAANHAKLYAFMKAMQQIPQDLVKKVCVCVDEIPMITFIDKSLRNMSENSFRSVHTGKLNKDLETSMEINKLIRLRQDFALRLKYLPNDIGVNGMYRATKLAIKASEEATKEDREERYKKQAQ